MDAQIVGKHIFISFSHHNEVYIRNLARRLNELGIMTWYYAEDQKIGSDWTEQLTTMLELARLVLVIVSQYSNTSTAVLDEVLYAKRLRKRMIGLYLEPVGSGNLIFHINRLHRLNAWDGSDVVPKLIEAIASVENLPLPPDEIAYISVLAPYQLAAKPGQLILAPLADVEAMRRPGGKTLYLLGRGVPNDLDFDASHTMTAHVSRRHARIAVQLADNGVEYLLYDTQSTHGTFVNGQRITTPHVLQEGDAIGLGTYKPMLAVSRAQPTGPSPDTTHLPGALHN